MAFPERTPQKLGPYVLMETLGHGSMGVVYRAYDESQQRSLALKTMASELTSDPDLRRRFHQEAKLAAKLRHPHIITIYDFGEIDGQLYIAMELLDGQDLKSIIQEGVENIPLEKKLDWMIQLCKALAFAHQHGITHRDIKPGNIHIRRNEQIVVTDFGIARVASLNLTRKGVILGTPEYISPEQILTVHYDHRADIFSLGLVSYELVTGKHPFRSESLAATAHRILNEKALPPHQHDPQIPQPLSQIILRSLEKDINTRYQNSESMLQDLLQCVDESVR